MRHPELVKHVPEFIASMQELIKRYQAALKLGISKADYECRLNLSCLLCNPIGVKENYSSYDGRHEFSHEAVCKQIGCPWFTILGESCDTFSKREMDNGGWGRIYNTCDPDHMNARIEQLREWIKIYSEFKSE